MQKILTNRRYINKFKDFQSRIEIVSVELKILHYLYLNVFINKI